MLNMRKILVEIEITQWGADGRRRRHLGTERRNVLWLRGLQTRERRFTQRHVLALPSGAATRGAHRVRPPRLGVSFSSSAGRVSQSPRFDLSLARYLNRPKTECLGAWNSLQIFSEPREGHVVTHGAVGACTPNRRLKIYFRVDVVTPPIHGGIYHPY